MGLRDKFEQRQEQYDGRKERSAAAAEAVVASCPDPETHYVTDVNKGSLNMLVWASKLNSSYRDGYRLAHVFEQNGNTVTVLEHSHP